MKTLMIVEDEKLIRQGIKSMVLRSGVDVEEIIENLNLPRDKKYILYAPTWRDNQHQAGIGYTYKTEVDFDKLRQALGDEYIILFRAHYLVANSFDFDKYKGFVYNVSKLTTFMLFPICS